ncbi:MAG: hypothetical protein V1712_00865 [Patescibacteria group bacterium]
MPKAILREEAMDFLGSVELAWQMEQEQAEPKHKLQVNEFVGFAAFAYEKLRNLVDYKDDVLLRKNAIRRLLRQRAMFTGVVKDETNAQDLLRELVLSRYLPNNTVAVTKADEITKVIRKYRELIQELKNHTHFTSDIRQWILGIEAVEIEHLLVEDPIRHPLTAYSYKLIQPVYRQISREPDDQVYRRQLVITIQRILEKADADILSYHLIRHLFSDWFSGSVVSVEASVDGWLRLYQDIQKQLAYPLASRLQSIVRKSLVPFIVLRNLIRAHEFKDLGELLTNPEKISRQTEESYSDYYTKLRIKIRRKGLHAMAYIFLTKMVLAIVIELPYERYVLGSINKVALFINLLVPPLLMLLITLLITSPGKQSIEKLIKGMKEILYGSEEQIFLKIPLARKYSSFALARFGFGILSAVTFIVSFGLIVYILKKLEFNILSGALFVFFVSLVSFFGISLRQQVNTLKVVPGKANIFTFILDVISLPMVWFGRWLSNTFDKINIFVVLLDFFVELPFKVLLKFLDRWFAFLREKKEEIF